MATTKEGDLFLIGFIALCQARSLENQTGYPRHPASVSAPESALGSLPSVALSPAQATGILITVGNVSLIYAVRKE